MQLEVLALHHQLAVYQRCHQRVRTKVVDRLLWAFRSRTWANWRSLLVFVQPGTVIAWQRRRFRDHWTCLSRAQFGRPAVAKEIQALIRKMSRANPGSGSPQIVGELAKLGSASPRPPSRSTWSAPGSRRRRPGEPSLRTTSRISCPSTSSWFPRSPSSPVRLRRARPCPTQNRALQHHRASNSPVDGPADLRGVSAADGASLFGPRW
jgi:hypothetical protein